MATREDIQSALAYYEQRGDQNAARKLKATLAAMDQPKPAAPPSLADRAVAGVKQLGSDYVEGGKRVLQAGADVGEALVGTAETAATLATGAVAAPIAGLGAGIYETARQILNGEFNANDTRSVDDFAARAAEQATYIPRTDTGRAQVQAIGKAIGPYADDLVALGPLAAEAPTIAQTARVAGRAAQSAAEATGAPAAAARAATAVGTAAEDAARAGAAAVRTGAENVTDAAKAAAARVGSALDRSPAQPPGPAGPRSAGAAQADPADVRRANAAELGFKDEARLTKGQATQETTEIGFEREQAKNLERGADIRQRYENQARVAENVFDDFVQQTGGSVPDFSGGGKVGLGSRIQKALEAGATKQKNEVRAKYTAAEKAEGAVPTRGDDIAAYIKENEFVSSDLIQSIGPQSKKLGILDKTGVGAETNLKTLYELRKFVSRTAKPEDAQYAREIKKLIDDRIAADGGPLYRQATEAHARFKTQYSDASLINGIIENKPGSPDRIIAADQVLNRILTDSTSVEEVKHMRRLLQTHGEDAGKAAWQDLQAGGIEYLRDVTYRGAKPGPNGTLRPNAAQLNNAVNKLDQAGKLDLLYGKAGAEKVRLFRDIVRAIENTEGANHSGTANALVEFLEAVPVAGATVAKGRKLAGAVESYVRDGKLRKRIKENLE